MRHLKYPKFILSILIASTAVLLSTFLSHVFTIPFFYFIPLLILPSYLIRKNLDLFLLLLFSLLFAVLTYTLTYFTPILFSVMMLLVPIYVLLGSKRSLREVMYALGFNGSVVRALLITFVSLFPVAAILMVLSLVATYLNVNDSSKVDAKVSTLPFYIIVYAVTLGPVAEELFFRSFLPMYMHPVLANVMFALAHFSYGSYFEIIGAFLMGLFLYAQYKYSGDIKVSIFTHIIVNLASIYVMVSTR